MSLGAHKIMLLGESSGGEGSGCSGTVKEEEPSSTSTGSSFGETPST